MTKNEKETPVRKLIMLMNQTGFDVQCDMISGGADALTTMAHLLSDKWKTTFCLRTEVWSYDYTDNAVRYRISVFTLRGDCEQFQFDTPYDLCMFAYWLLKGDPNVTPAS